MFVRAPKEFLKIKNNIKELSKIDGLILINKPKGWTSHDVINKLRSILHQKKIGHTGTLDPMATGVLPVLLGNATKLSKYLIEHDKTYIAVIKLGIKTNTGDEEGEIIERKEVNIDILKNTYIEDVLKSFIGNQKQKPPIYSAIKINGKKLYEYARNNESVEIQERDIEVYEAKLLEINKNEVEIRIQISVSKGTYIRKLCEDISEKLGTVGYMKELERIRVDKYYIKDTLDLDYIKNNIDNVNNFCISIEEIFDGNNKIILPKDKLKHFLNGVMLTQLYVDGIYRIYCEDVFIGIGIVKDKLLKRDVVVQK